jgi:pimeloyl-ACP methyl ester carboxylesterase
VTLAPPEVPQPGLPRFDLPWMPPAEIVRIEGRGEFFVRRHQHPDPDAPTVVLLHGWTVSADLQFFTAYEELAEHFSFIGLDHRGHGRGLRTLDTFAFDDVADDNVAVCRELGIEHAVLVGYSMGGPIALTICQRHRGFATGVVVQGTALEWLETRRDRWQWRLLPIFSSLLRSRWYPTFLSGGLPRLIPDGHELTSYVAWCASEIQRGNSHTITQAGRALSSFDARGWASGLAIPAASLITTKDRLVRPRKQRALAAALNAEIRELAGDHGAPWEQPRQFSSLTVELVTGVVERSARTVAPDNAAT